MTALALILVFASAPTIWGIIEIYYYYKGRRLENAEVTSIREDEP